MKNELLKNLPKTMLAPMAGYTDAPTRVFAKRYGCGITVTEMVSAQSLVQANWQAKELLTTFEQGPVAVQLFGHNPDHFAKCAQMECLQKFDVIDVNMGCPVRKIVSNGDGSALMGNVKLASEIVTALKNNTDKVVSVKMRLGQKSKNAVDFAKAMEQAGADYLTVHGRTATQMYSGVSDKEMVLTVAKAVSIPVFANGDVKTVDDFNFYTQNGCHGVAIGRGALGRPYVFAQIDGKDFQFDLQSIMEEHLQQLTKITKENVAVNEMKKHVAFYMKGVYCGKQLVIDAMTAKTKEEMLCYVQKWFKDHGTYCIGRT